MGKAEEYESHAARCLRLARIARDADSKAVLIEMARTWQMLAGNVRAKAKEEEV
jgi:hypothetical protein